MPQPGQRLPSPLRLSRGHQRSAIAPLKFHHERTEELVVTLRSH